MKTIAQLRALGFTLSKATHAESCTTLEYPGPFYYFNPKFCASKKNIVEQIRKSSPTGIGSTNAILVAGDAHSMSDDTQFPFEVLDVRSYATISSAYRALQNAQAVFNDASFAFNQSVAAHLQG
jgi:hypothetical protein